MLGMKYQTHCIAVVAAIALTIPLAAAQGTTTQGTKTQGTTTQSTSTATQPAPVQRAEPTKAATQDQQIKDASGKQITVDHGANLAIGPNDKIEFNSQITNGPGTAPIMILNSGWIYLYEGGYVYKIRQSDMKLIAKTAIGPDAVVEPPPTPARRTSKSTSSKRKRH
jgi:hypothetical protein